MSGRRGAVGLGRVVNEVGRAVGVVALLGMLALPAGAGDGMSPGGYSYPAPGYFADGLTAESSWEQILKPRTIVAQFPLLNFGKSFVPLSAVCVDGDVLRIADPRIDNGVRIAASSVPGYGSARAGATGYAAVRADQFAAGSVSVVDQPLPGDVPAPVIRYPVSVYRVMTQVGTGTMQYIYLFQKPWEVPRCASR